LLLEVLDDRIVPSAIGLAPMHPAALVEHSPTPLAIHAIIHHPHKHHPKVHAAPHLTSKPISTPQVPSVPMSTSLVVSGSVAAPPVPTGWVAVPLVPSQPASTTENTLGNVGQDLNTIYKEFLQQGGSATFTSSLAGRVEIHGTNVGVDVNMASGNFGTFVSSMTKLGMQVQTTDATHGIVEGFLPIAEIPAAAQNPQTLSLSPIYIPNGKVIRL